jgi:hypothetical protein
LKNKYRTCRIAEALTRGLKMPAQNVLLTDVGVGEKSIGRFRVSPVLAGEWNALTHVLPELLKQQAEAFLKSFVSEVAGGILLIHPRLIVFRRQRMTSLGIVSRPPRRHLITIMFLM